MFQKRTVSVLLALALSASSAMMCAPGSFAADNNSVLSEIQQYNPSMIESEILEIAISAAQEEGMTTDAVLDAILAEIKAAHDVVDEADTINISGRALKPVLEGEAEALPTVPKPVLDNPTNKKELPLAKAGDIYWVQMKTAGIPHNHVGIYYSDKMVVEAQGIGKLSVAIDRHKAIGEKKGAKVMTVKTTAAKQKAAANYAKTKLVGKKYNINFATNKKDDGGAYNCSQLVWAAYKKQGIDLDSNGGLGVYPNDIIKYNNKTIRNV